MDNRRWPVSASPSPTPPSPTAASSLGGPPLAASTSGHSNGNSNSASTPHSRPHNRTMSSSSSHSHASSHDGMDDINLLDAHTPSSASALPGSAATAATGAAGATAAGPTVEQMQRQMERYREKLANGMREFKKLAEENDKLRAEARSFRATAASASNLSSTPNPSSRGTTESPEEVAALRVKTQTLEKELAQLRFNAKLKIKQLQKEVQAAKGGSAASSPAVDLSGPISLDPGQLTEDQARIVELEDKLREATIAKEAAETKAKSAESRIAEIEERAQANIAALESRHAAEMDAFELRVSQASSRRPSQADLGSTLPLSVNTKPSDELVSLIHDLAAQLRVSGVLQTDSSDGNNQPDLAAVIRAATGHVASTQPQTPEVLDDHIVLLQSANQSLRKRLSSAHEIHPEMLHLISERDRLKQTVATLEQQLAAQGSQSVHGDAGRDPSSNHQHQQLAEEIEILRNELEHERSQSNSLRREYDQVQQRLSVVSIHSIADEEAKETLETVKAQLSERASEVSKFKAQAVAAMEAQRDLARQVDELKGQLSALEQANQAHEEFAKSAKDLSSVEQRNFTLEEQASMPLTRWMRQLKDFRIQIANRQREAATLQEALATKTGEYEKLQKEADERIRKMKGLLLAANKSMTETKKLVAQRDTAIEDLKTRLEASTASETDLRQRNDHLQRKYPPTLQPIESQDEREARSIRLEDLEKQLALSRAETQDVRNEFQGYKVRAAAALQKSGSSAFERRVTELEELRQRLERDIGERDEQLRRALMRVKALESDVAAAVDQIAVGEAVAKRLERSETELQGLRAEVESLTRRLNFEKQMHEDAMRSKELGHSTAIEQIKAQHARQVQELESARDTGNTSDVKRVQADLDRYRKAARNTDPPTDAPPLSIDTSAQPPQPPVLQRTVSSASTSSSPQWTDVSLHAQQPLHRTGSFMSPQHQQQPPPPPSLVSYKEKEYQIQIEQLRDLLTENEAELERLHSQERFLKEELRRIDRMDRRQDLNVEYLKNVVLSFVESDVREPLVPILAQILHLSPEEAARVAKKSRPPVDDSSLMSGFGFFG
ncbi:hypothetical protein BC831DRAFT_435885 [Entophlyctis helioformis]|nr:hypothetical protein BC831DRAFT_435885 [Entophlyctis helioformis]